MSGVELCMLLFRRMKENANEDISKLSNNMLHKSFN